MEHSTAYKFGQVLAKLTFAIFMGLIIGFGLVYWKMALIAALIVIVIFILIRTHKEVKDL